MPGRRRTFEKIDKSHTTPGFRPLPGESGAVEISEVNFKQCAFLYSPDEVGPSPVDKCFYTELCSLCWL